MLEPITALGLASNVIQLVDFTARVLSKSSKEAQKRESIDHARLSLVTSDLKDLSTNLKNSLILSETYVEPDENDKAITPYPLHPVHPGSVARLTRFRRWKTLRTSVSTWPTNSSPVLASLVRNMAGTHGQVSARQSDRSGVRRD